MTKLQCCDMGEGIPIFFMLTALLKFPDTQIEQIYLYVSVINIFSIQMWQLQLQQKEEVDELTTKCEQLETKYTEKVKECKHVRVFNASVTS